MCEGFDCLDCPAFNTENCLYYEKNENFDFFVKLKDGFDLRFFVLFLDMDIQNKKEDI